MYQVVPCLAKLSAERWSARSALLLRQRQHSTVPTSTQTASFLGSLLSAIVTASVGANTGRLAVPQPESSVGPASLHLYMEAWPAFTSPHPGHIDGFGVQPSQVRATHKLSKHGTPHRG